jgi:hypothetical protein
VDPRSHPRLMYDTSKTMRCSVCWGFVACGGLRNTVHKFGWVASGTELAPNPHFGGPPISPA